MFYKFINDKYIVGIGTGSGGEEITEKEYNSILETINNRPEAPEGYSYRLTTALEWELCETPKIEPTTEEEIIESEEYYE
ncbi:hypothetical protein [Eubacterium sp.]|jgi:hypothetical protein